MRFITRAVAAALAVGLLFGLSACSNKDVAAKVNGEVIKKSEVDKQIEQVKKSYPQMFEGADGEGRLADLRKRILDSMVDAALITQYAEKNGIAISDKDVEKQMAELKKGFKDDAAFQDALKKAGIDEATLRDQLKKQLISQKVVDKITKSTKVSDKQVKEYYDKNKKDFTQPAAVHAAHILFEKKDKATAEKILAEIKDGGDFAALAKKHSKDPGSATKGGDLGWPTSPYVAEFQKAADALKAGEMSGLVESPFGWHIIKVVEKRPERQRTMADAKADIEKLLISQQQSDAYQKFITQLRKDAKIEVLDTLAKAAGGGAASKAGTSTGK